MNTASCQSPLAWDTLLAYWLGELDADGEARAEEHYLGCTQCSQRLDELASLAEGVRALVRAGEVGAVISEQFVHRLTEHGLHVREYRVPCNGSVNCTVAPEDDIVVAHLAAPLADVARIDVVYSYHDGKHEIRNEDIPFDPESDGVAISVRIDALRALPATTLRLRLLAVANNGERTVGEYTFNHAPYENRSGQE